MEELLSFLLKTHHLVSFFQIIFSIPDTKAKILWLSRGLHVLNSPSSALFQSAELKYWLEKTRDHLLNLRREIKNHPPKKGMESLSLDLWELQGQLFKLIGGITPSPPLCRPFSGVVEALVTLQNPLKIPLGISASLGVEKSQSDFPSNFTEEGKHQILLAQRALRYLMQKFPGPFAKGVTEEKTDLFWFDYPLQNLSISGESIGLAGFCAFYSEAFATPLPWDFAFTGKIHIPPALEQKRDLLGMAENFEILAVGAVGEKVEAVFWNRPWIRRVLIPKENLIDLEDFFFSHSRGLAWNGDEITWENSSRRVKVEGVANLAEVMQRLFPPPSTFLPPPKFFTKTKILIFFLLLLVLFFWIGGNADPPAQSLSLWMGGRKIELTGKSYHIFSGHGFLKIKWSGRGYLYVFQRRGGRVIPLVDFGKPANRPFRIALKKLRFDQDWFFMEKIHPLSKEKISEILLFLSQGRDKLKQSLAGLGSLSVGDTPKGKITWNLYRLLWKEKKSVPLAVVHLSHLPIEIWLKNPPKPVGLRGEAEFLSAQSRVNLNLKRRGYLYIFSKKEDNIRALKPYWISTEKEKNSLRLSLKDFDQKENWLFVFRENRLTKREVALLKKSLSKLALRPFQSRGFREKKKLPFVTRAITPWNLYTERGDLLLGARIYKLPILMKVYKNSKGEFRPFFPKSQWLKAGDQIQVRLQALGSTWVYLVLYNAQKKVNPLFGPSQLSANQIVLLPSQGGFVLDESQGIESFFCFYSPKKMEKKKILSWMKTLSEYFKNPKGKSPYPLYVLKIRHRSQGQ